MLTFSMTALAKALDDIFKMPNSSLVCGTEFWTCVKRFFFLVDLVDVCSPPESLVRIFRIFPSASNVSLNQAIVSCVDGSV